MILRRVAWLFVAAVSMSACGGSSGSTSAINTDSSLANELNPSPPASTGSTAPASSTAPSLSPGAAPPDLLIDSSLDIGAIDGPVVLWFWAPG